MNITHTTKYLAALALMASSCLTLADDDTTVSVVTFQIKETYTAPALTPKDGDGNKYKGEDPVYENEYSRDTKKGELYVYEAGSKMRTFKITNKVILEALVDAGEIDSIVGWSIVFIETDGDDYLALQRPGETRSLSEIIDFDFDALAEQFKYQETEVEGDDYYSYKAKGSGKFKATVEIDIQLENGEMEIQGILSGSEKLRKFGKGEDAYYVWLANRRKISSISGDLYLDGDDDDDDYNSVLEGSVKIANAKLAPLD